MLVESIYNQSNKGCGVSGIRTAFGVLHHLATAGNRAASKRRGDIEHMCDHLGVTFEDVPGFSNERAAEPGAPVETSVHPHDDSGPTLERQLQAPSDGDVMSQLESPSFDWTQMSTALFDQSVPPDYPQNWNMADVPFGEGICDLPTFYLDDFALTGVVEADWEELSRQFTT